MALNFFAGQAFNGAGRIAFTGNTTPGYYGTYGENGNQPDFSQWSITAGLYDQDGALIYLFAVTNLSNINLPTTNGAYQVIAPGGDTDKWPIGKAQILVKAVSSGGTAIYGTPMWYRIAGNPMLNQV